MSALSYDHQQACRNHQFDLLRSVAIVAVLVIHSAARYALTTPEQIFAEGLRLLMRPAIAIFLFLAGALFVAKPVTRQRLSRQYARVLVPYLLFSVLALYYDLKLVGVLNTDPQQILWRIIFGDTFSIYYYVFVIVVMYGVGFLISTVPVLYRHLIPCTIAAYMLNIVHTSYGSQLWAHYGAPGSDYIVYADRSPLVWACFFLTGMLYQRYAWQAYVVRWRAWLRSIWCLVTIVYMGLYLSGLPLASIDGYHSPIGTTYAVATIGGLLTLEVRGRVWAYLSERSYFLYLAHIFFVYGLLNVVAQTGIMPSLWWSLISFWLSLLGPLLIYWMLKRLLPRDTRLILGA